ncbi:hypothetical protein N0V94_009674 [Neodidymelliopsis sp. IMI 364377]|nr:hypothetical protein N0V94_009674 [Neodidymelliopsis sp. IMI 364377]
MMVLVLVGEEEVALQQSGDDLVAGAGDGDADGVLQGGTLEGFDLGGHGGGEEVGVAAVTGQDLEDLVEDGAEVEVEQTIGFVEDHVLEVAQREALCVFEMVEQSTGGCNDNVGSLGEGNGLGHHVHATDEGCALDVDDAAQGVDLLGDLVGQFTGRGQDETEE